MNIKQPSESPDSDVSKNPDVSGCKSAIENARRYMQYFCIVLASLLPLVASCGDDEEDDKTAIIDGRCGSPVGDTDGGSSDKENDEGYLGLNLDPGDFDKNTAVACWSDPNGSTGDFECATHNKECNEEKVFDVANGGTGTSCSQKTTKGMAICE